MCQQEIPRVDGVRRRFFSHPASTRFVGSGEDRLHDDPTPVDSVGATEVFTARCFFRYSAWQREVPVVGAVDSDALGWVVAAGR